MSKYLLFNLFVKAIFSFNHKLTYPIQNLKFHHIYNDIPEINLIEK